MSVTGGGSSIRNNELETVKLWMTHPGDSTDVTVSETADEDRLVHRISYGDHFRAPGGTLSAEWYLSVNDTYADDGESAIPNSGDTHVERGIPLLSEAAVEFIDDSTNGLAMWGEFNDWPQISLIDSLGKPFRWEDGDTMHLTCFLNAPSNEAMSVTLYYTEA